jgi:hypothetical protein
MAVGEKDNRVLKALATAREQHEELTELLDFYYDLYEVQFQAKARVPEPVVRDEMAMRWRLERAVPQLAFGQLRVEPGFFEPLVAQVAEVLLHHNPTWQLEPKEVTSEDLLSLARDVFETWDTLTGPEPGSGDGSDDHTATGYTTALAVSLSLAPYLQQASDAILPQLDLTLWKQATCPICGGRPNFSILDEEAGARKLMCSRCASLWGTPRVSCPFCAAGEKATFYSSEDDLYRLYVCPECKHYLKAVDLRKARRVIIPMVERLLTVGMDLTARQEGYES